MATDGSAEDLTGQCHHGDVGRTGLATAQWKTLVRLIVDGLISPETTARSWSDPESGALPLRHAPTTVPNPCSGPAAAASSAVRFAGSQVLISGTSQVPYRGSAPSQVPTREARELYPLRNECP